MFPFENDTVYSKALINALANLSTKPLRIFLYICGIGGFLATLLLFRLIPLSESVLYFVASVYMIAMALYFRFVLPKIRFKRNPAAGMTMHYVFDRECMTQSFAENQMNGTATIAYFTLYKAWETAEYFFLYLEPKRAAAVSKQGMTHQEIDLLRKTLQQYLPKKFKTKY